MMNFLIFAQRTNIRKISLDVNYYSDVLLPIPSMKNAIAISVDKVDGTYSMFFFIDLLSSVLLWNGILLILLVK